MIALLVLLLATPPADADFKPWTEKDGVAISIARTGKTPWVRGAGTVDKPCDAIVAKMTDWDAYAQTYGPMVKKAKVLEKTETGARLHVIWPYPWPLRARDGIMKYTVAKDGDRTRMEWVGDAKEGDPKSVGVRITDIAGSALFVPDGEKCNVLYTFYGDLGGDFGKSSNEKAWKGEPVHWFDIIRK